MNHCNGYSGVVCRFVGDASWPVKKSQVLESDKTVPVHTMCKVYKVTRTLIQGQ